MVYANKIAAAVKVSGRVLRENQGTVTLPFGAEYSVLVKNLNSVRIKIKVSVDGQDATEGTWLIVEPNRDLELERFIRNGNFDRGNRFKFIERTGDVEAHRGVKVDDGLVRIEYLTEQRVVERPIIREKYYDEYIPVPRPCPPPRPWPWGPRWICSAGPRRAGAPPSSRARGMSATVKRSLGPTSSSGSFRQPPPANMMSCDTGITVPGSESQQKFVPGAHFPTESQSQVLVIKLRGEVGGKPVAQAVTVAHKPQCSSCGRVNKGGSQFCSRCGTALSLI